MSLARHRRDFDYVRLPRGEINDQGGFSSSYPRIGSTGWRLGVGWVGCL